MASPQIVSSNTGNFTVGTLTSATLIASITPLVGNVILAAMVIVGTLSDPGTIVSPVGWELIQQDITGAGSTTRVAVFAKIASGSETGSYDFTWAGISAIGFWIFAEYGNGDPGDAVDGVGASQRNALGTSSIAPSIDPSAWNSYNTLVCVWAAQLSLGNIMSMGAPTGMVLRAQSSSGLISFPALLLADLALTSEAPTDTKTATAAFATPSLGVSFLIKQSIWATAAPVGASGGM